jgi:colanic acid biosynthesis glycosyl transferase WcaI
MRILVWGINYAPEVTGIAPCNAALCEFLRQAGHDVRMLTTFRYYPEWQKAPGDAGRLYRTDIIDGVPVHRCWHYVPRRVSTLKRVLHEGTFVLLSFLRALTLPRPDVAIIVSPPLLLGAAGWLLGRLRGVPFIFHVQDLQPDAAVGLGMLKPNAFTRMLYRLEAFAYAKAARVSGISQGMLRAFAAKGVPEEKRVYFPNGVPAPAESHLPPPGRWRGRQGFGAEDFLAVYAGNLGLKQGLDILLAAARLVRDSRVRIVICGQGAARERLLAGIEREQLPNLHLLPLQDDGAYREMMADTDLCLITQQAGTGQYFFPSKLLTALAFAKPVLAVADADSELAHAMNEGGFGFLVPTEQPQALGQALVRAAQLGPEELAALGEAGQRFGQRFALEKVLGEFARVVEQVGTEAERR